MEICNVQHESNAFHYSVGTHTMSAEASTLQQGNTRPLFGRVYDDACDEGFVIVSQATRKRATFVVCTVDTDREGDIVAWHLEPTPQTKRDTTLPAHVARMLVTVFND